MQSHNSLIFSVDAIDISQDGEAKDDAIRLPLIAR
jgi:hypothetical protein